MTKTSAVTLFALVGLFGCDDDEVAEDEETISFEDPGEATETVVAPTVAPSHGGTVVMAGPYPVEVVGRGETRVEAYFVGDDRPEPRSVHITARVPTAAGERPVVLVWDPREDRFRGRVTGTTLSGGPVRVVVESDGQTHRGDGQTLIVIAAPPPPPAPTVEVRTPSSRPARRPAVVVERPAPPPPPVLVVERPQPPPPPGVVIVEGPGRRPPRVRRGRARGPRVVRGSRRGRRFGRRWRGDDDDDDD